VETGTIPSKTFREAVLSFTGAASHFERHLGSRIAGRPTASQFRHRVEEVIRREADIVQDQLWLNDIALIHGKAAFQDAHRVVVTSKEGGGKSSYTWNRAYALPPT